jgi:hypothetical protein
MEIEIHEHDVVIVTDEVVMIERTVDTVYDRRGLTRTTRFLVSDGVQEVDVSYIPLERLQEILNI